MVIMGFEGIYEELNIRITLITGSHKSIIQVIINKENPDNIIIFFEAIRNSPTLHEVTFKVIYIRSMS